MSQKRTDADHIRLQFFQKHEILDQILCRLKRRTDHKASTNLITDLFQCPQTTLSRFTIQWLRMQLSVMTGICCLFPQQIPVCPGFFKAFIAFIRLFTNREGKRTVRIIFLNPLDNIYHLIIGIIGILASL